MGGVGEEKGKVPLSRPDAPPWPNVVSTRRTWRVSSRSESKRIFASIKLGRKFGFLWCAPLPGDSSIASSSFRRETSPFVFFAHAIRISRSNFSRERERERWKARRWKALKLTEDRSRSMGGNLFGDRSVRDGFVIEVLSIGRHRVVAFCEDSSGRALMVQRHANTWF